MLVLNIIIGLAFTVVTLIFLDPILYFFGGSDATLIRNEMNILELSEQEIIRRNSLNELRAMGIDPYPAAEYVTNAFSTDIKAEFKDEDEPRQVSVAGRIMSRRVMGKASFIELQDSKGRIQVYITRDRPQTNRYDRTKDTHCVGNGKDREAFNAVCHSGNYRHDGVFSI